MAEVRPERCLFLPFRRLEEVNLVGCSLVLWSNCQTFGFWSDGQNAALIQCNKGNINVHPESSLVGCWLVQNIIGESFTAFCRDLMIYSPVLLIVVQHNGVLNGIWVSWQSKASALHLSATTLKFYTDKWRRCSYYVLARGHVHQARRSDKTGGDKCSFTAFQTIGFWALVKLRCARSHCRQLCFFSDIPTVDVSKSASAGRFPG